MLAQSREHLQWIQLDAVLAGQGMDTPAPVAVVRTGCGVAEPLLGDGRMDQIAARLLPLLVGDLYLQYRFETWERIDDVDEDISTDTITLGGAVRLTF